MLATILISILTFATYSHAHHTSTNKGRIGVTVKNRCREPVDVSVYYPDVWHIEPQRVQPRATKTIDICRGAEWCGYHKKDWTAPRAHDFSVTATGIKTEKVVLDTSESVTVSGTHPVNAHLVLTTC